METTIMEKLEEPEEFEFEFNYFKDILVDILNEEHTYLNLSGEEINYRAQKAAEAVFRDDLTTTQCVECAMSVLEDDLIKFRMRYVS